MVAVLLLALGALPAAAIGDVLAPGAWQPKQAWQKEGAFWQRQGEGAEAFVRLHKTPCVLESTVPLDGAAVAQVHVALPLRVQEMVSTDQWKAVTLLVQVQDAAGKTLDKSRTFVREDRDWTVEGFDLQVPSAATRVVVRVEFRAESGTVDVRDPVVTVVQAR